MTFIDLEVPGDTGSVYDLADFIDTRVGEAMRTLDGALPALRVESSYFWYGMSADAFRNLVYDVEKELGEAASYLARVGEALRAYARRLERGRERFDDLLDEATQQWCYRRGREIIPPDPPVPQMYATDGPPPPPSRTITYDWGSISVTRAEPLPPGWYEDAKGWVEKTADEVGQWWEDLANWVAEHLGPLIAEADDLSALPRILAGLQEASGTASDFSLNLHTGTWDEHAKQLALSAKEAQEAAESHSRRLRSGHPGVRAGAEAVSKPELKAAVRAIDAELGRVKWGSRILGSAGWGVGVATAAVDIAMGGSPSSNAVELLGGAGVAAAGGAVIATAPVSLPTLAAAGIITGLGWAGAKVSGWAWESTVPLDVREAIDAGDFGYVFD